MKERKVRIIADKHYVDIDIYEFMTRTLEALDEIKEALDKIKEALRIE